MTMDERQGAYEQLRQEQHPNCVVCGQAHPGGLRLQFRLVGDGIVEATFACKHVLQGYHEILHGGTICSILDGAMTNCAFAAGVSAMTGDLYVRFLRPVAAVGHVTVRAWIEASCHPLYRLQAELQQEGELKATAKARFLEKRAAAALRQPGVLVPS